MDTFSFNKLSGDNCSIFLKRLTLKVVLNRSKVPFLLKCKQLILKRTFLHLTCFERLFLRGEATGEVFTKTTVDALKKANVVKLLLVRHNVNKKILTFPVLNDLKYFLCTFIASCFPQRACQWHRGKYFSLWLSRDVC